jgi:hyperosmotically inducible protein
MRRSAKVFTIMSLFLAAVVSPLSFSEGSGEVKTDNTLVNKRDRAAGAMTADQQGMNASDTALTQKIRSDLIADKDISSYAKNVKIIAMNGTVTLKGPVRTAQEEQVILKRARAVAGRNNVKNEMTVEPMPSSDDAGTPQ